MTTRRSMSAPLSVRPAVDDDTGAVTQIAQRSFARYVERIGRRPAPMDVDYRQHIAAEDAWVAVADGRVVGFVVLVHEPDVLEVDVVAVDPDWQGHGIGSRLLDLAAERGVAAGKSQLTLYTNESMTENLAWYRAHGFIETRRGEQAGYQRVWFRKQL